MTFSVALIPLEVSVAFMQGEVLAVDMWVTIFFETMQVGVSVAGIIFYSPLCN